jgi:formylglycine-generating enzyme required for sulfatase activity
VGQPPQTFGSMVWIPSGTFTMGSPASEPARDTSEGPQTRVTITQGFWMGRHEVKQSEYLAVMGSNPSYFAAANGYGTDLNLPVETVSWNDAVAYCAALTTRERNAGRLPAGYAYRLPTEAEWEYACRAGTTTVFHYGAALRSGMANFYGPYEYPPCAGQAFPYGCHNSSGTYLGRTTSVGSYAPNAWGLYDMHGNVWEWCSDRWSTSLPGGSVTDPQGSATGSFRVIRGGSWRNLAFNCRSAYRYNYYPGHRYNIIGFRVVLASGQP